MFIQIILFKVYVPIRDDDVGKETVNYNTDI